MNTQTIKEQIKKIKEVQTSYGLSEKTINSYQRIYQKYLDYVKDDVYNQTKYQEFLLNVYNFDITKPFNKSNTKLDNLYHSMMMLENLDNYIAKKEKRVLSNNLKHTLTDNYINLVNKYKTYCKDVRYNADNNIEEKANYASNLLAYFISINIYNIKEVNEDVINTFINLSINKSERSKSRYFAILRDFLVFLYVENILLYDYSYLVPSIRKNKNIKLPSIIKENDIKELLENFPKERKIDKRNYAIILMASELGMRISDILNLKFENINWLKNTISFNQVKTKCLNTLPLSKKLGWAIIDYIKNARPITESKYVFVKHSIPYGKINQFNQFNKYFFKESINDENKKGIHNLRNSLATRMLENEIPLPIISQCLGHSSVDTTLVYLKIDTNKLKTCGLDVK